MTFHDIFRLNAWVTSATRGQFFFDDGFVEFS